jgi:5-dehydro-4-deoxyglucarate dehydratase
VRATLEAVNGRVPVLTGAGFNPPLAAALAKNGAEAGVDGILAFPPYYPGADPEGLFHYYRGIAEATQLGLIVYSRDWVNPSPDVVERFTEIENLIAWKDGTGDMRRCQQLQNRIGDRLLWIGGSGDDQVPAYYSIGMRTYTSSIANVAPKLSLALHELGARGDTAALTRLMHDYVIPLYELRARRRGYEVSVMKEMMRLQGRAAGPVRPPLVEVTEAERAEIRAMFEGWAEFL